MSENTPKEEAGAGDGPVQERRIVRSIVVCDKCFMASCWHGKFMCQESQHAGTTTKTITELEELNLEHPEHWEPSKRIT